MRTISWTAPKASWPGMVGTTAFAAANVTGMVDVRPVLGKDQRAGGKDGAGPDHQSRAQVMTMHGWQTLAVSRCRQ